MSILTREEIRDLINGTANNDELRARLEEFADIGKSDEEQKAFARLITELDAHLAKAAGTKPANINPATDRYGMGKPTLFYIINGSRIRILGSTECMSVTKLEVYGDARGDIHSCAEIYVRELGPQEAVEIAVGITAALAE